MEILIICLIIVVVLAKAIDNRFEAIEERLDKLSDKLND